MMAEFENACRKADLKVTHQRLEIYRELARAKDHPSAEMLYNRIIKRLPTISLDTVYRTLATFEKHRLITRVQTVESQARFEAETVKHHHAVCTQCGTITDFTWESFDEAQVPEEVTGWGKVVKRNATLEGICNKCARKS
ncbi:MAG: transcriptional repressor [Desulfobulbaceae bacterium]|nr:transcriptional repressor [Desulfobulbaceae bacterium]